MSLKRKISSQDETIALCPKIFQSIKDSLLSENIEKEVIIIHPLNDPKYLFDVLKKGFPLYWFLHIELKSKDVVDSVKESFEEFLCTFISTQVKKSMFKKLYEQGKVVVVISGIDEILLGNDWKEAQKNILFYINRRLNIQVIFVSNATFLTVKNVTDTDKHGNFLYEILPLNENAQKDYLVQCLEQIIEKHKCLDLKSEIPILTDFILNLPIFTDKSVNFSFYIFLLSKVYTEKIIEALENEETMILPDFLELVENYASLKMREGRALNPRDILVANHYTTNFLVDYYTKVSLETIFGKETIDELEFTFTRRSKYFELPKGSKAAEVDEFMSYINGKHVFINKIFSECFVAQRFYEILIEDCGNVNYEKFCKFLVQEILVKSDYERLSSQLNRFIDERSTLKLPIVQIDNAFKIVFREIRPQFFSCLSEQIKLQNWKIYDYVWSLFKNLRVDDY